jgi:hypothetical protein
MSEYYLPSFLASREFWAQRDKERCLVEFDLEHPDRVPPTYPVALVNEILRGTGLDA